MMQPARSQRWKLLLQIVWAEAWQLGLQVVPQQLQLVPQLLEPQLQSKT